MPNPARALSTAVRAGLLAGAMALSQAAPAGFAEGMNAFEASDFDRALQEWITPASSGDVKSLYGLGTLYAGGLGVPQDFVTAHVLFNVAAFRGDSQSASARDAVEGKMTPEQITRARAEVLPLVEQRQWVPSAVVMAAQAGRQSSPAPSPAPAPPPGAPPAPMPPDTPPGGTMPAPAALPAGPAVEFTYACQLSMSWEDKGSGGRRDVTLYDAAAPAGYFVVGGYAQGNYDAPDGCVMALRERSPGRQLLIPPQQWRQTWGDKGSGARMDGSIWTAVPPGPDHVCLGAIAEKGYDQPRVQGYACVHKCLLRPVPVTGHVWSDAGTGARDPISLYRLPVSNSFVATAGEAPQQLLDVDPAASCP